MNDQPTATTPSTAAEVGARLAPEPTPEHLRGLADRLGSRADDDDLVDLAPRIVDSPIGPLLVVVGPTGVVRLALATEDHDAVLDDLARQVSPRILPAPKRTDPVVRELDEFFAGHRRDFETAIDLRLSRGFRREVLDALRAVPHGATVTYTILAERAGNPRAVRAAGSACATNPIPIFVPCHRVLRSDGGLGGYRGGIEAKRLLLDLEARP